jgi:hypothetical protein
MSKREPQALPKASRGAVVRAAINAGLPVLERHNGVRPKKS